MGKFGIGARVKDYYGDLATITDKRKGERFLHWDDQVSFGDMWWPKSKLTPVEPCAEKGELAYPVGTKLRWLGKFDSAYYTMGEVYEVISEVPLKVSHDTDDLGGYWSLDSIAENFEVVVPFKVEVGKFYSTRDGRKVGPIVIDADHKWPASVSKRVPNDEWRLNGTWTLNNSQHGNDLVAEWIDVPVDKPATKPEPKFKVEAGKAYLGESGAVYSVVANFDNDFWPFRAVDSKHFWAADGKPFVPMSSIARAYATPDRLVALAPPVTLPIGTKVTLTGTVTGINNGNRSVVLDTRPLSSIDFPATALSAI